MNKLMEKLTPKREEAQLVGALLMLPNAIFDIEAHGFKSEHIANPKLRAIYETVREMILAGKVVTPMTVEAEMADNGRLGVTARNLMKLMNMADNTMAVYTLAPYISERWRLREVALRAQQLQAAANAGNEDEAMRIAVELLRLPHSDGVSAVALGDALAEALEELQNPEEARETWLHWPREWRTWQRHIRPIRPGHLANIAAASGVGKSTYIDYIAFDAAARGHNPVIFTIEDEPIYRTMRVLARFSGIPLAELEDGVPEDDPRLIRGLARLRELEQRVTYVHAPAANMALIEGMVKRLRAEGRCSVVFIDYIDLLSASPEQTRNGITGYAREADDMRRLKALAGDAGIPIVFAAQRRKGSETNMSIADVRGSGARTFMAQLVVLIRRDLLEAPFETPDGKVYEEGQRTPITDVHVVKQSRGGTVSFKQWFEGETYTVFDVEMQPLPEADW